MLLCVEVIGGPKCAARFVAHWKVICLSTAGFYSHSPLIAETARKSHVRRIKSEPPIPRVPRTLAHLRFGAKMVDLIVRSNFTGFAVPTLVVRQSRKRPLESRPQAGSRSQLCSKFFSVPLYRRRPYRRGLYSGIITPSLGRLESIIVDVPQPGSPSKISSRITLARIAFFSCSSAERVGSSFSGRANIAFSNVV